MKKKIIIVATCVLLAGCGSTIREMMDDKHIYNPSYAELEIIDTPKVIIVRPTFNPAATKTDYEKAYAECKYDANKATVDTSLTIAPIRKQFIPTNNFDVNMAQIRNNENATLYYEIQKNQHERDLIVVASKLREECLSAKGFKYISSVDEKDFALVKKYCLNYELSEEGCFIPANKQ